MKLKSLKQPLVLFLILTLAVGTLAAGVSAQDGFGSDSDEQTTNDFGSDDDPSTSATDTEDTDTSSDDFGSDSDDSGDGTNSDSETEPTSSHTGSDGDDVGSSRDGFGEDVDDEGFGNSSDSSTSSDEPVSQNDFGGDTDDSGSSEGEYGDDTDDSGTSRDGTGDDTDDAGSSRDGFGGDTDDQGPTGHDGSDGNPSMDVTVSPEQVLLGETVEVTGTVEGVEDDVVVELNSEQVATTIIDSNGEFSASFQPQEEGSHMVTVSAGELSESFTLDVITQGAQINSVTWPQSVEAGANFQVCADVTATNTPEVTLYVDGQLVQTQNQQGVTCFQTSIDQTGSHELRVEATADGETAQRSATVNVFDSGTGGPNGNNGNGVNNGPQNTQGPLGQFIDSVSANAILIIAVILVATAAAIGLRRFR